MGNSQSAKQNKKTPQQTSNTSQSSTTGTTLDYDPKDFEWEKDNDVPQRLDFDLWYPLTSSYTPKSTLIECTQQEIEAITISCDENRASVVNMGSSKLTLTHKNTLKNLQLKIDQFIQTNNFSKQGIFIRFSKRSPKDSVLRMNKDKFYKNVSENAIKIFTQQKNIFKLNDLNINKDSQITNAIIRAMTISSCKDLCCFNGNDAIQLITYSQRIFQDFKIGSLMFGDQFKPKLILREFNHNILFEYEFRVFIFKNNITAITQYNSMIYLIKIINNQNCIKDGIISFWENNIHPNMLKNGITSYVMDIGLLKNNDNDNKINDDNDNNDDNGDNDNDNDNDNNEFKFILIEMNPFCTKAGAMLFDWKKDIKIMTSTPITFRILDKPFVSKPKKLTAELSDLFDKLKGQLGSM